MTKIHANIGGPADLNSPAVGRQAQQEWRQPPPPPDQQIDWNDPAYATPRPAPKRRYGKYVEPVNPEVPQLPERLIRVRAVPPATYYSSEGVPIPDEWTTLPISAGLLAAIQSGDLERGEDPEDTRPGTVQAVHRAPVQRPPRAPRAQTHSTTITPPGE